MIQVENLVFSRRGRTILDIERLRVQPREKVALIGPSGGGKTTLIRLLAGLETPEKGCILLDGCPTGDVPGCRPVSLLAQDFGLWPHLTAGEHIAFVTSRGRTIRSGEPEWAILDLVGLKDKTRIRPGRLSGGEQQRLALARAVAGKPKILLLDEPFSNLDEVLRHELLAILADIHRQWELTLVMVTHNLDEAIRLADRILIIREGRLVQQGSWAEITARPDDPWSRKVVEMRAA